MTAGAAGLEFFVSTVHMHSATERLPGPSPNERFRVNSETVYRPLCMGLAQLEPLVCSHPPFPRSNESARVLREQRFCAHHHRTHTSNHTHTHTHTHTHAAGDGRRSRGDGEPSQQRARSRHGIRAQGNQKSACQVSAPPAKCRADQKAAGGRGLCAKWPPELWHLISSSSSPFSSLAHSSRFARLARSR